METYGASHDLEAHIPELRRLDGLRKRSAWMRDRGLDAVVALSQHDSAKSEEVVHRVTAARVRLMYSRERTEIERKPLEQLLDSVTLEELLGGEYPTLAAAQCLHGAAHLNSRVLARTALMCWCLIVRELHTVAAPDWSIGGARVAPGGWATAHTTAQCVRAVASFRDALQTTSQFFMLVNQLVERLPLLDDLRLPRDWNAIEKHRLTNSMLLRLSDLAARSAIPIELPKDSSSLLSWVASLSKKIELGFLDAVNSLTATLEQVAEFRRKETNVEAKCRRKGDAVGPAVDVDGATAKLVEETETREAESAAGHIFALASLKKMHAGLSRALKLVGENTDWNGLASIFSSLASDVVSDLTATRHYLSSIIDRQLAQDTASGKTGDPAELVFAAVAHAKLAASGTPSDARLQKVVSVVFSSLVPDFNVLRLMPFHKATRSKASLFPSPTVILLAVAELLGLVKESLTLERASSLLPYLEEKCIGPNAEGAISGWHSQFHAGAGKAPQLWATSTAVEASAAINVALDEGINEMILDHFSVKHPHAGPDLDDLFYSDYGLASRLDPDPSKAAAHSVAMHMHRMRAHLARSTIADPLHSLVLHGPAGTGKTTLVEALARTAGVPLVEVTPSDISKGGEDSIEQRARAVFEALSLLTRVVILFDEFDPILRRRDSAQTASFNIFSFLTPGMLPKLKELSECAKKRSVAYVLITNLIGTLDEAAIRQGRFDAKLPIFPPDPLSRLGRLQFLCATLDARRKVVFTLKDAAMPTNEGPAKPDQDRLITVVARTGGLGMTLLSSEGWFRLGSPAKMCGRPIDHIFNAETPLAPRMPGPEDRFDGKVRGSGEAADREYELWGLLEEWEQRVRRAEESGREPAEKTICEWQKSVDANSVARRLLNDRRGGESRLLVGLLGDDLVSRWMQKPEGLLSKMRTWLESGQSPRTIRAVCKKKILSADDMHVFNHCVSLALDQRTLIDSSVTSHIIQIAGLSRDFMMRQEMLIGSANGNATDDDVNIEWAYLQQVHRSLDGAMARLLSHIVESYESYLASSDFLKQQRSIDNIDDLVERAIQARRSTTAD